MMEAATSRTCETPPELPSTSALLSVCTESTTSSFGSTFSTWPSAWPRSVSAERYRVSAIALDPLRPQLHLGRRFLARDIEDVWAGPGKLGSHVQQQRGLSDAGLAREQDDGAGHHAAAEHAVQFVHARWAGNAAVVASTSAMGRAGSRTVVAAVVRATAVPVSSTVPHAWHSPQRPTHLTVVQPHSAHL
jgi:hypothetical protein